MKLLFFTDTHMRGSSPQNRTDDFPRTVAAKVEELVAIAEREEVAAVLHGGDFFDLPNPSPAVAGEFFALLQRFPAPVYGIVGNHDLFGHNPETLPRTFLGLAARLGIVRLLQPGEPVYLEGGGLRVQLTGQPYHFDIDRRDPALDYVVRKSRCDVGIHLVHGMLLDRPFVPGTPHTLVERCLATEADLTLCGHNHLGFPLVEDAGRKFFNPGGIVRVYNHVREIERRPQAVLIDLGGGRVDLRTIPLQSARPGPQVLDRSRLEADEFRQERLARFVQSIRELGRFQGLRLADLLEELSAREGLDPRVREEALRRIAAAEMRLEGVAGR